MVVNRIQPVPPLLQLLLQQHFPHPPHSSHLSPPPIWAAISSFTPDRESVTKPHTHFLWKSATEKALTNGLLSSPQPGPSASLREKSIRKEKSPTQRDRHKAAVVAAIQLVWFTTDFSCAPNFPLFIYFQHYIRTG